MLSNFHPIASTPPISKTAWPKLVATVSKLWHRKANHHSPIDSLQHIGRWRDLFNHQLTGQPTTLKSNNHSVRIEQTGELGQLRLYEDMGILAGGDIEICFYTNHWRQITHQPSAHKVNLHCQDDSQNLSWQLYSDAHADTNNLALNLTPDEVSEHQPRIKTEFPDTQQFQQMWASLSHVHQFYDMLSLFELDLLHAIKLMQNKWTFAISSNQLTDLLQQACNEQINTKILAGNRGIIHSLTGPIDNVLLDTKQIKVAGHNYHCHIEQHTINETWLVKRATKHGIHHSIEAFDNQGCLIAQVQEKLEGNQTESPQWLRCLGRLGLIPMP